MCNCGASNCGAQGHKATGHRTVFRFLSRLRAELIQIESIVIGMYGTHVKATNARTFWNIFVYYVFRLLRCCFLFSKVS
jgi:hypothetical protein